MDEFTKELAKLPRTIISRSYGLPLVVLGFMVVYFQAGFRSTNAGVTLTDYLVIGFGFIVTLSGVLFMAVELRRAGVSAESVESAITSSDLDVAVGQLAKNYDILRGQATQGFILAAVFMLLGIVVILAGAVGELFGFTQQGTNLTTVAGIVIEAISGIGLYLFRSTFNRLNRTSDLLMDTWKILAAFKKAENLPDDMRGNVQAQLIDRLVGQEPKKVSGHASLQSPREGLANPLRGSPTPSAQSLEAQR